MKKLQLQFKEQIIQMMKRTMVVLFVIGFFGMTAFSQIATTTPASRCGEGTLVLHATATSGTIKWYTSPFYGAAIVTGVSGDGTTFTTPSLIVTTAYYVDAVDGSNCSLNSGRVRVPVLATISANSIQAAIFYSSNTFCKSILGAQTVTRTGTAGGVYSATAGGLTINSASGDLTPSSSTEGTYTVTYTVAAAEGCVENPASTSVTIANAPLTSSISYSGSPFCTSLTSATVTLTNPNGGTFSASPSGLSIDPASGTINPSLSLPGTYTVTYFVSSAGGCSPQTPTASITITGLPTAVITYTGAPFCQDIATTQTPILTGTGAYTGGTYSYTGPGTLTSFNSSTGGFVPSTSGAGTYTVTYTAPASANCAAVPVTTSIKINTLPTAGIAGTLAVCQNASSPVITFTGSTGTAPYTFTYQVNGGAEQTITTTSGSTVTVAQSTVSPGAYIYTLLNISDANGCSHSASGSETITVNTLRVATFSYTNTPYCNSGTDASPAYTGGGEAGTFTSTTGLVFATGEGILPGTVDLSESTPGTYTVTNTIGAGSGCGVVAETATITITKLPVATFSYPSAAYCSSGVNPTPTITEGATLDSFTADPSELIIDAATGEVNLGLSLEGIYTITRTIASSAGCLPVIATTTMEIVAAPTQPVLDYLYYNTPNTNYNFCNSDTIGFAHRTGSPGGIYTILPATGLTLNASSGSIKLLGATPGNYTVTYTIAAIGGCGALTATAPVTIIQGPTVEAGGFQDVCSSSTVSLSGTIGGSASSATWTTSGTGTFNNANSLSAVYTLGAADITAGTVRLRLTTDAVGQCRAANDTTQITIFPAATVSANIDQTVCASSPSVTLAGTIGGGASSGTWSGGTGTYNPNNSTLTAIYTPSAAEITAGTVTLTLTTNDPTGPCGALTDQMTITINPLPLASAGGSTTICSNSTATVTGASSANGTISWTEDGAGSITAGATTLTPTYIAAAGDEGHTVTLTMTVTTSFASCSSATATATYTVLINSVPTAGIAGTTTVCRNSTSPDITFTGANGTAPYTFTYKINTGSDLTVTTTSGSSVTVSAPTTTAGTYTYTLLSVHDANTPNCSQAQTGSAVVTVDQLSVAAAGADQALCATTTFTMAAVPTVGTGAWTFVSAYGTAAITAPTSATTTITSVPADMNITLRWTETNGTCSSTDDVVIRNNSQSVAAAGADQALCTTTTFTMAAVPTVGTGAWTFVGTAGSAVITTPTSAITTITSVPADMDITLRWTETNGTCSSIDDVVIRNNSLTATPAITTITSEGTIIVTGTSEANAAITVYKAGTTSIGTATANGSGVWSVTVSGLVATDVITAKATVTGKCVSAASAGVTVPAAPTGTAAQSFCSGSSPG